MSTWCRAALAAAILAAGASGAVSQAWPTKYAIKVIVPFTAGNSTEISAREAAGFKPQ